MNKSAFYLLQTTFTNGFTKRRLCVIVDKHNPTERNKLSGYNSVVFSTVLDHRFSFLLHIMLFLNFIKKLSKGENK